MLHQPFEANLYASDVIVLLNLVSDLEAGCQLLRHVESLLKARRLVVVELLLSESLLDIGEFSGDWLGKVLLLLLQHLLESLGTETVGSEAALLALGTVLVVLSVHVVVHSGKHQILVPIIHILP